MELSYPLGITRCVPQENFPRSRSRSHIINPLLTNLVRSRWLDIGLVLFLVVMDLDFVSVHKHAKKELGQYAAILTEQAWSITHIYFPLGIARFVPSKAKFFGVIFWPYKISFTDQASSVKMTGFWRSRQYNIKKYSPNCCRLFRRWATFLKIVAGHWSLDDLSVNKEF